MSCSANIAPPWPWNDFTCTDAAGAVRAPAPTIGSDGGVCATLTVLTELSTDCAAVMVRPAWVRPLTKPRREIPFDRYLTTRSLMICSLAIEALDFLRSHARSSPRKRGPRNRWAALDSRLRGNERSGLVPAT